MRVMFVCVGAEQLNVSLMAPILRRAGHTVGLAFSRQLFKDQLLPIPALAKIFDDDDVVEQVVRFRPDVVCFSALTVTYRWMLGVAEKVKALCGAKTVFGGSHPSGVKELVLEEPAVDFVCVGEGDIALPMLLEAIARGPVDRPMPNMMYRDARGGIVRGPQLPFFQDLDRLPGLEKDLWSEHIRLDQKYTTITSRGCPYRCTFCYNNYFAKLAGKQEGAYLRQRSVDHFMAELREAKRRYKMRFIDIEDDVFTVDVKWLKEFAPRYRREIGVPFYCLSHPNYLDQERVDALKEAGCVWTQFGVQSADEQYKTKHLRRYEKYDDVAGAMERAEKAGIRLAVDHMFGLPGEAVDAQDKALELYSRNRLARLDIYWLAYYPGTEMMDIATKEGTITTEEAGQINRGFDAKFYWRVSFGQEQLRKIYLAYQFVMRAFPILPPALRRRIRPRSLTWVPTPLLRAADIVIDILVAVLNKNHDLAFYCVQLMQNLENHFRWRRGLPPRRRFGAPQTGPLKDPAWDRVYEESVQDIQKRFSKELALH